MNSNERFLLNALAHELFSADSMPLDSTVDLQAVLMCAKNHSVSTLIYPEFKGQSETHECEIASLRSMVLATAMCNEKLLNAQDEVIRLLKAEQIPCAVLKGTSLSVFYPHSELRALGDIDLLVPSDMQSQSGEILKNAGYYHSVGHSFHECYEKNDVHIELHQAVTEFPRNPKGQYASEYMKTALDSVVYATLDRLTFPMMDVSYQLVSLLTHMERHMLGGAIGLRQLCDWAITVDHFRDVIDVRVLLVLEQCGLMKFAKALTKGSSVYLKMPSVDWTTDVDGDMVDSLIEDMLSAGNLRNVNINRAISSSFVSNKDRSSHKTMIGLYISNIDRKARNEHPEIKKLSIILPIFWVFYPIRYWIRSLYGKREAVAFSETTRFIKKRKKLYDELMLYQ